MERAVDEFETFIDENGLDCAKTRPGFLRAATTKTYITRLRKQVELMKSLGFSGIDWIEADETRAMVGSPRYLGAMWEPRLLLVDPARLVREEKRLALELGAKVYEGTPVLAVASGAGAAGVPGDSFRILTPGGSLSAGRLVFATNGYSHLFPEMKTKQIPAFTYMVATAPLTDEQLAPIGWAGGQGVEDARNLIHYYRLTPERRIVMGGGPVGLTYGGGLDADSDEKAWRHLERHIGWLWPHLEEVEITHRWGGPFSVTMDLTPALGYLGDRRVVYSLGCIGHGVSMSYLNGRLLRDLLLDGADGELARGCPFVNRRVVPWPPEPLQTAAARTLRGYLRTEDAVHERLLNRA
jgi:glycine/D-amino acid oxidase-like deaminating enzyme